MKNNKNIVTTTVAEKIRYCINAMEAHDGDIAKLTNQIKQHDNKIECLIVKLEKYNER